MYFSRSLARLLGLLKLLDFLLEGFCFGGRNRGGSGGATGCGFFSTRTMAISELASVATLIMRSHFHFFIRQC